MTAVIVQRRATAPATPSLVAELAESCSLTSLRRRFFLPDALDRRQILARYGGYLLAGPPPGAALVALASGRPVGLLNLIVEEPGAAEASLLVADAWQRRGVATSLLTEELTRPRWAGWTVRAIVEPDNLATRQLLRRQRLGPCRLVGVDPTQFDFAIALPEHRHTAGG